MPLWSVGNAKAVWASTPAVTGHARGPAVALATHDGPLAERRDPGRERSRSALVGPRADHGDIAGLEPRTPLGRYATSFAPPP